MRFAVHLVLLAICLAPGLAAAKGKPEPVECPGDVAAALAATCPCDGSPQADSTVVPWRNHGQYVRCVVHLRNAYSKAGCIDDSLKRSLARCAARSTCGKEGTVLCCKYDLGTCSDLVPGDATASGTCSNEGSVVCDVDADCTTSQSSVAHNDGACLAHGGVDVGAGSACPACPPRPAN